MCSKSKPWNAFDIVGLLMAKEVEEKPMNMNITVGLISKGIKDRLARSLAQVHSFEYCEIK